MLPYATWLFDLDGTLVDHFDAIYRAHAHTMRQLGLPPPTMEQVRAAVGRGLEKAVETLVGPERTAAALAIYRPFWDATMLDDVKLFPGARELLEALRARGARLAVLTNKHAPSSRRICEHLGIASLLDAVFGAGDTRWLKPNAEFTRHALAQLHADAGTTVLVGDSIYDVATAKNAGIASWCVTTGTHTAAQLSAAGADRIFPDLVSIARALNP